jgi:sugar lactone lactonase YvrE
LFAVSRNNDSAGARRAFWLKAGLVVMAALVLVLAGVYSARAQQVFPKVIPLPTGWQPEGIATGRGTDFYVSSLANGAIYKGDLRTGEGGMLNPGAPGRATTGLKVDKRTNYVFASGAFTGKAFVFDGDTGAQLAEYQLATPGDATFINDVVVTRDAAYFTDSFQRSIYKLPLGPGGTLPDQSQVETITLGGEYQFDPAPGAFNANGIDATPNGKMLVIVQSNTGFLYTVDPNTGFASRIDLGGALVTNGDGILLQGKTLYVVQNQNNQITVIDLNGDLSAGTITRVITDTAFSVPTTIAPFGKWLYAVNAKFGAPAPAGIPYEVVQVNK